MISPNEHDITPENAHLLRSGYAARREGEMAVLERWFEGEAPVARASLTYSIPPER